MVILVSTPRSGCPINFGLQLFGDRWTLLVLRDLLIEGKSTFKQFLESEERIATNILADRLSRLERAGIVRRSRSGVDKRNAVYSPTEAGTRLLPVLIEMAYWGATHDPRTSAPKQFVDAYENDREGLISAISHGFDPTDTSI